MIHDALSIEIVPSDGHVTLRLTGEIDIANAASVREAGLAALSQDHGRLQVDLSGVTFIDLSGLDALFAVRRRVELEGGRLQLLAPGPSVLRILELTGVERLFLNDLSQGDSSVAE